jgi:hypothetical protein
MEQYLSTSLEQYIDTILNRLILKVIAWPRKIAINLNLVIKCMTINGFMECLKY